MVDINSRYILVDCKYKYHWLIFYIYWLIVSINTMVDGLHILVYWKYKYHG